jgi:hypothetical protein
MNDYLTRQLIADRQATIAAAAEHRAQVREALAARRSRGQHHPLFRRTVKSVKRAAHAMLAVPALTRASSAASFVRPQF